MEDDERMVKNSEIGFTRLPDYTIILDFFSFI